jgi:hypothetical protein
MKVVIAKTKRPRRKSIPAPAAPAVVHHDGESGAPIRIFARLPRLQLGRNYSFTPDRCSLELGFDLISKHDDIRVQYRVASGAWRTEKVDSPKKTEIDGIPISYQYQVVLDKLTPGQPFEYIVLLDKQTIFSSTAKAPPAVDKPFTLALTGDIGDGGNGERETAAAIHKADPDVVLLVGDVVYEHGRVSELDAHFTSIYNADECDPALGAPLLRSRLMASAVGNHDMGFPVTEKPLDLDKRPDLLGFFLFWRHPKTGPEVTYKKLLTFSGKKGKLKRLVGALGEDFLTKANYSFDFGNVHCIVLDANKYMNWATPDLYEWLKNDLESAKAATWKIVVWHQPPFNSDTKYCRDERMAVISPLLELYGVDLVFNGHCHFYERSLPLRVKLDAEPIAAQNLDGTVNGTVYLDKSYDGVENQTPDGIIYVVTGAGGRPSDEDHRPVNNLPFAAKLVYGINSFTKLDVDGAKLTLRQLGTDGTELDKITIDKTASLPVVNGK